MERRQTFLSLSESEQEQLALAAKLLDPENRETEPEPAVSISSGGRVVALPAGAVEAVAYVLRALADGKSAHCERLNEYVSIKLASKILGLPQRFVESRIEEGGLLIKDIDGLVFINLASLVSDYDAFEAESSAWMQRMIEIGPDTTAEDAIRQFGLEA